MGAPVFLRNYLVCLLSKHWIRGLGSKGWGFGGSRSLVYDLSLRALGLGLRVQGLGLQPWL